MNTYSKNYTYSKNLKYKEIIKLIDYKSKIESNSVLFRGIMLILSKKQLHAIVDSHLIGARKESNGLQMGEVSFNWNNGNNMRGIDKNSLNTNIVEYLQKLSISFQITQKVSSENKIQESSIVNILGESESCKIFETGQVIIMDFIITSVINKIAFSPDDRRIAASDTEGNLWLWSVNTGRLLAVLRGHTLRVPWLQFDAGGKTLFSASWDGTIRRWKTQTR